MKLREKRQLGDSGSEPACASRCKWSARYRGGLSSGSDVSDDCLGKPYDELFQLAVLVFQSQKLLQLCVRIDIIETIPPFLRRTNFLHRLFLRLEASVIVNKGTTIRRKSRNSTDATS
jgi:hypothetical protein